jgi:hypothetical protein
MIRRIILLLSLGGRLKKNSQRVLNGYTKNVKLKLKRLLLDWDFRVGFSTEESGRIFRMRMLK